MSSGINKPLMHNVNTACKQRGLVNVLCEDNCILLQGQGMGRNPNEIDLDLM